MTTTTPDSLIQSTLAIPLFTGVSFLLSMGSMALMTLAYWHLAALPSGDVSVGWVSSTALFSCIILAPLVGTLIDAVSKRKLLAFATCALCFSLFLMATIQASLALLASTIITGQIFLSVFYPTQFAIIRENFAPSKQGRLNVSIDIATQAAGLSSSLAFILVLATLPLAQTAWMILIPLGIGALTALFLQDKQQSEGSRPGFLETLKQIPSLTRQYKQLIALSLASRIPFIFVVTLEVAQPVHFQSNIEADLQQHTIVMLLYGLFSVIGGSLSPFFIRVFTAKSCLIAAIYVFLFLSVALFFIDTLWGFRTLVPLVAVVGTLIRISGNQILLEQSGDGVIGRISATLQILTYFVRFTAMMILTAILVTFSAKYALFALVLVALFGPVLLLIYMRWSSNSSDEQNK